MMLAACGSGSNNNNTTSPGSATTAEAAASFKDTVPKAISGNPEQTYVLEDLLRVKDENELKTRFGAQHVINDTIWGPEGTWYIGTILLKGTTNEVEIAWKDTLSHKEMAFARVHGRYMNGGELRYDTRWKSSSGVQLGMTTSELEGINGGAFLFSGFDWDYGGYVTSWEKGSLDKKGVLAMLAYGASTNLSELEMREVSGDKSVRSDNAIVKRILPKVYELTVNETAAGH